MRIWRGGGISNITPASQSDVPSQQLAPLAPGSQRIQADVQQMAVSRRRALRLDQQRSGDIASRSITYAREKTLGDALFSQQAYVPYDRLLPNRLRMVQYTRPLGVTGGTDVNPGILLIPLNKRRRRFFLQTTTLLDVVRWSFGSNNFGFAGNMPVALDNPHDENGVNVSIDDIWVYTTASVGVIAYEGVDYDTDVPE